MSKKAMVVGAALVALAYGCIRITEAQDSDEVVVNAKPEFFVSQPRTTSFVGIRITVSNPDEYWHVEMPCGQTAVYPLNGLPLEDVPCPCGKPSHWLVRYQH